MPELDVLYMTRIQRERFFDPEEYERLKDSYILTPEKLETAKKEMCILHPLPRVNEISVKVDDDPRACYFDQALNGKYMRMALILKLLETVKTGESDVPDTCERVTGKYECKNPRCITSIEQEIEHTFRLVDKEKNIWRCAYCESIAE